MKQVSVEALRRSRRSEVEVGKHTFIYERPTPADVAEMSGKAIHFDFISRFVVGWRGIVESDLFAGGDPEEVEFNAGLFSEWAKDRPDLWKPLGKAVLESYYAYEKSLEERGNA